LVSKEIDLIARYRITDATRAFIDSDSKMFIDGSFVDGDSDETFDTIEKH
jgi:hypothetical protein